MVIRAVAVCIVQSNGSAYVAQVGLQFKEGSLLARTVCGKVARWDWCLQLVATAEFCHAIATHVGRALVEWKRF